MTYILVKSSINPICGGIDTVLAGHYGFTAELDFILNYDIKYRLGRSTGEAEEP
jgi:hypothetical protein